MENIDKLDHFHRVLKIIKIDKELLSFIDREFNNLFQKMKDKLDINDINIYINNSNYFLFKFRNYLNNRNNLNDEEIENMINALNFIAIFNQIRKKYIWIIVLNTLINKVYNFNDEKLIFLGTNYFIMTYSIKGKEFVPILYGDLIPNKKNYNNFEIKYISSDSILLDDKENKIIYTIDLDHYLLKKNFNYYSNILINNNYILFDSIENNELKFTLFNILNNSIQNNNKILKSLHFKINCNIPKILLWGNFNTFIFLYDNNQLCIAEYILDNDNKVNLNQINNNRIININENNIKKIPKIHSCSQVFDNDYRAQRLFDNKSYYCSKYPNNQFIIFDYENEHFLKDLHFFILKLVINHVGQKIIK